MKVKNNKKIIKKFFFNKVPMFLTTNKNISLVKYEENLNSEIEKKNFMKNSQMEYMENDTFKKDKRINSTMNDLSKFLSDKLQEKKNNIFKYPDNYNKIEKKKNILNFSNEKYLKELLNKK